LRSLAFHLNKEQKRNNTHFLLFEMIRRQKVTIHFSDDFVNKCLLPALIAERNNLLFYLKTI